MSRGKRRNPRANPEHAPFTEDDTADGQVRHPEFRPQSLGRKHQI